MFYSILSLTRSVISTPKSFAVFNRLSKSGWLELVHHLDIVVLSLPNCSASHLFVRCLSARTTFIRFNCLLAISIIFYLTKVGIILLILMLFTRFLLQNRNLMNIIHLYKIDDEDFLFAYLFLLLLIIISIHICTIRI